MSGPKSLLLALNAGSSSLKAKVFALGELGELEPVMSARLDGIGRAEARLRLDDADFAAGYVGDHLAAAELLLTKLRPSGRDLADRLAAIGHRIVHGGERFTAPTRIVPETWHELDALGEVAPLHNPPALGVVHATAARHPGAPQFAVFDTAFFASLPPAAREYAVPAEWRSRGLRRFGFHGLAHEYLARTAFERCNEPRRLVTLQLGHGCSATALLDARPVDTSMGFSPLEGLIMATRPGDLDAGVLLELARRGESWQALTHSLHRDAGLRGLSDASGDVKELLALEAQGHAGATLALDAFCRRIVKYLGAYAAVLGGLDAIAIGGGIGENSPLVRERIVTPLAWLGVTIDAAANARAVETAVRISAPGSSVAVEVIAVDEELVIAEKVRDCLAANPNAADRERRVS